MGGSVTAAVLRRLRGPLSLMTSPTTPGLQTILIHRFAGTEILFLRHSRYYTCTFNFQVRVGVNTLRIGLGFLTGEEGIEQSFTRLPSNIRMWETDNNLKIGRHSSVASLGARRT
jgi:hypothetical protein